MAVKVFFEMRLELHLISVFHIIAIKLCICELHVWISTKHPATSSECARNPRSLCLCSVGLNHSDACLEMPEEKNKCFHLYNNPYQYNAVIFNSALEQLYIGDFPSQFFRLKCLSVLFDPSLSQNLSLGLEVPSVQNC